MPGALPVSVQSVAKEAAGQKKPAGRIHACISEPALVETFFLHTRLNPDQYDLPCKKDFSKYHIIW